MTIQLKGRIERPFAYVETNFLAGRGFDDFDDLNRQAVDWCRNVANHKPKQALGMSPEAAYVIERPHLVPLPEALPPVYELLERVVDLHGYVSVDTNRYSVLGRRRPNTDYADLRIMPTTASNLAPKAVIAAEDAA